MKVMVISAISPEKTSTYKLARAAADVCESRGADIDLVTPAEVDLPVNDGTLGWKDPRIEAWRGRLADAEAHIWVSPEYHGGMAASLKNLFDYLDKAPLEGEVVGLCALAAGAVAALNTLNGMTTIARSLGAWVVPNVCAFNSSEVRSGLDERAANRLDRMIQTVLDTAERLSPTRGAAAPAVAIEDKVVEVVTTLTQDVPEVPPEPVAPDKPAEAPAEAVDLPVSGVEGAREIARGVSGVRYAGTRDGSPVFVRVVPAKLLDDEGRRQFETDREAVERLPRHPNIAPPLHAGMSSEGEGFAAMAAAPTLAERIAESGPIPSHDALAIGVRLAGALETIHRAGILHRDITPDNVLFDADGRPMLADIALAPASVKALERQRPAALAHVAPERFTGEDPAPASDIYALGATLFTMVLGRPAFSDASDRHVASVIRRIALEPVPDLRTQLPEKLCSAIERAMAKNPAERFGTAEELGRELQQAEMLNKLPTATMTLFAPDARLPAEPLPVFGAPTGQEVPADTESGASET